MQTNPLQQLPEVVKMALLKAGWVPGKVRPHGDCLWKTEHQLAQHVLDELAGLNIAPMPSTGSYRPLSVSLTPAIAKGYEAEIEDLGARLRTRLTPIANVGNGVAIMLLAESGHVLFLGFADRGVLVAGISFGEAMQRTLQGQWIRPMIFDNDPDKIFWNDEFGADPHTFRPGYDGLRSLVKIDVE